MTEESRKNDDRDNKKRKQITQKNTSETPKKNTKEILKKLNYTEEDIKKSGIY